MSRARKVKIVAVALVALCLVCFLLSTRFAFGFYAGDFGASCWNGGVSVTYRPPWGVPPRGVFFEPNYEPQWAWVPSIVSRLGAPYFADMPLWIPFALCVILAALAHRRARKPRPEICGKCGYDLTGNASKVCPECGTHIAALLRPRGSRSDCADRTADIILSCRTQRRLALGRTKGNLI
jgi:hypothetical protein